MTATRVGYAGGTTPDPTYQRIGDHTETFQVDYDPARIGYGELLEEFFASHNAVRPAYSTQYKSVILCHDDGQRAAAREAAERVSLRLGRPVLTEVRPLETFYLAEEYHQKYYWKHFADAWKRAMREEAPGPASAEFAHWLETGVLPGCGVR